MSVRAPGQPTDLRRQPRRRKLLKNHNWRISPRVSGSYWELAGVAGVRHYKDECLCLHWRFCKKLGHHVAECPIIPEGKRRKATPLAIMEAERGSRRMRLKPVMG